MTAVPGQVPRRPDLGWLRHRSRRGAGAAAPEPHASAARGGGTAVTDFLAGRTTRRRPVAAPPSHEPPPAPTFAPPQASRPGARPSSGDLLDPSDPAPGPGPSPSPPAPSPGADMLDLSASSPAPSPPASGRLDLSVSDDLYLSGPSHPAVPPASDLDISGPPAAAPSPSSSDLDLFPEPPPSSPPAWTPAPAPRPTPLARTVRRVAPGGRVILTSREPTVTLDRVQSGVGALTLTAVCSPAVGDLVLGAVYQLADGSSGVLSRTLGIPSAPPRSRLPALEASRGEFDQIRVDLRQSRFLRRFVVYAMSASEGALAWGGTLLVATHGGSRVEIPLDLAPHAGPVVVASVYVIDGEFVVRAELDPVRGLVRDVAQAYGYRAITWADPRTPVL